MQNWLGTYTKMHLKSASASGFTGRVAAIATPKVLFVFSVGVFVVLLP
jgi:hypothetical protein